MVTRRSVGLQNMQHHNIWTTIRNSLGSGAAQLIYPNLCWICTAELCVDDNHFCTKCIQDLFNDPHESCPRCASSVGDFASLEKGCSICRKAGFAFNRAIKMGVYEEVLRDAILQIKHQSGEGLAEVLGIVWVRRDRERIKALQSDLVIPVPLHWRRRLTRGYNQAQTLARTIASHLNLPCFPSYLRRRRNTSLQSRQSSASGKKENVRGAFSVRSFAKLKGKRVLLVDDVMTSGATAHEAARTLRRAGAESVAVAVLAHGHHLSN